MLLTGETYLLCQKRRAARPLVKPILGDGSLEDFVLHVGPLSDFRYDHFGMATAVACCVGIKGWVVALRGAYRVRDKFISSRSGGSHMRLAPWQLGDISEASFTS